MNCNSISIRATFETAVLTVGEDCETDKVQTALSAVASTLAEPVTVIPSLAREAKPAPTFINPPPSAIERITAAAIRTMPLLRSMDTLLFSRFWLMTLLYRSNRGVVLNQIALSGATSL